MKEIVIKIHDYLYERICKVKDFVNESYYMSQLDRADMYNAIKNGKVLPDGHGRLIDADAVLEKPIGNTEKDIDIAETIIEADKEAEE